MHNRMFRRRLPAISAATLVVVAAVGVHAGLGARSAKQDWTSTLKTGDVATRGTVWQITVTPAPDEVEFWASGKVIAIDKFAPFETALDLPPGDYKLGFCYRRDGAVRCASTETGAGQGIVARVTIIDKASAPAPTTPAPTTPAPTTPAPTTPAPTTPAPTTPAPTTPASGSSSNTGSSNTGSAPTDRTGPRPVRRINVTAATSESVTVHWSAVRDNGGVAGYGVYLDSQRSGSTTRRTHTFNSLRCGTGYTVGVDAFDFRGNRSLPTSTTVSTSACLDSLAPTAPTGVRLGAVTATSAVLSWQPSTDNVGVVGYGLYVGGLRVASTNEPSATVTGLECGRSYDLGLDAVDAAGNRSARAVAYFTTAACAPDRTAPSTPGQLAVQSASSTSVTLSWSKSTDDRAVAGYGLYRGSTRVASTTETSATFSGLVCGTSYQFGIDAADAAGNRSPVAHLSTFTQPCPPPSGVEWTSSLKTGDVVKRGTVWRVTTTAASDKVEFWASGNVIATDRSAPFETALDLPAGGYKLGFCYTAARSVKCASTETGAGQGIVARVTVTDDASPPNTADTTPPTVPGSLRVVSTTGSKLTMSWSPATDNTAVAGYGEYQGSSRVGSTTQTSSTFSGLTCGTAYQLGVDAVDPAGNRSPRADMTATTAACADTQAPSAPTNIVVAQRTGTSIALSWAASTDDTGVTEYGLYQGGTLVSTASSTTGIVSGLTCGTSYTLGVDAADGAGNRSPQAVVMVSTSDCADTQPPAAPTGLTASSVTQTSLSLRWVAATDNVGIANYSIYRNGTKVGQTSSLTYPISGLTCGTPYTFAVEAHDTAGNVSTTRTSLTTSTSACADTDAPAVPTGLKASAIAQTSLTLQWTAATDNVGVTGYSVYRNGTMLGQTSSLTYPVSGLTCGTSYTFSVESRDAAGNVSLTRASLTVSSAACSPTQPLGTKLLWAPPVLSDPTTITVTDSTRYYELTPGRDYIVKMPATPLGRNTRQGYPALWLAGGRNVVIIGGEIKIDELANQSLGSFNQRGLVLSGQTGTVHIEGLWIHGSGMAQAVSFDNGRGPLGTVQIENTRIETMHPVWHTASGDPVEVHSDSIQSWEGPAVLRLYQDTIISNGTVLQVQPRQYDSSQPLGQWDFRHVNFVHQAVNSYALWKSSATWAEYHQDLWLKTNPDHVASGSHSAWAGNGNCWPCYNPGGSWPITGEPFNLGLRPGGDFVPSGSVGTGYVTPGYQ